MAERSYGAAAAARSARVSSVSVLCIKHSFVCYFHGLSSSSSSVFFFFFFFFVFFSCTTDYYSYSFRLVYERAALIPFKREYSFRTLFCIILKLKLPV
jgi:hypothetical protein